jgi:hypothetical protein
MLTAPTPTSFIRRLGSRTWFVASAALTALLIHHLWREPWFWLCLALVAGRTAFAPALAKWRLRRQVLRGDVQALLRGWDLPFENREAEATVRPLLRATVLASHGCAVRAEQVLGLARKGRLWEQSLEHRLMLASLIACLNGQHARGIQLAECLAHLPLPTLRRSRKRAETLRRGTLAMARAYAHLAAPTDVIWLRRSARVNPLLTWPMRYAELLVRIDQGQLGHARSLLATVPNWPATSCFHAWTGALRRQLSPETN